MDDVLSLTGWRLKDAPAVLLDFVPHLGKISSQPWTLTPDALAGNAWRLRTRDRSGRRFGSAPCRAINVLHRSKMVKLLPCVGELSFELLHLPILMLAPVSTSGSELQRATYLLEDIRLFVSFVN